MSQCKSDTVNFATLVPDEHFFPVEAFHECLDHAFSKEGRILLQYGGTLGYLPLRELIAERNRAEGIDVSPEQILVVNGSQQGIDLVLRTFLSPGDKIALSIPTYHHVFPLIRQLRADVAPVAMTDRGPDLHQMDRVIGDASVRLIYIMPNYQNPTGITLESDQRRRIYNLAARANLPILEDDFEKDLALLEKPPQPIKALDQDGRVIYLSTFSKSLFPGLRIGWLMASGEILGALTALKRASDLENAALLQAAAWEFCRRGYYEEHLEKIRIIIRERMEMAFNALERYMPEGAAWSRPQGGYVLWIRLPEGVASERIFHRAREAGVLVSPGTLFSHQGNDPGGIRISLSRTDVGEIQKGIEILGQLIVEEMTHKSDRRPSLPEGTQHL
jgi:DNA-binding transcriptional MocR family regulator